MTPPARDETPACGRRDPRNYAGNPALKLPVLETPEGNWFGAFNICRELSRRSQFKPRIVWPEDLEQPLLANTQELVIHAMATEVALIMAKISGQQKVCF